MISSREYIIPALKTAIIYALFGGLWILFSDKLLGVMVSDLQTYAAIQTCKGWLYIIVTAALIFHLTYKNFKEMGITLETLTASDQRYKIAAKAAKIGTWEWDIRTDDLTLNNEYLRTIGYDKKSFAPILANWEALIHPNDKTRVLQALDDLLTKKTKTFSNRYRILTKDGQWSWVQDRGQVFLWDEDGSPIKAIGVHIHLDDTDNEHFTDND